VSEGNPAEDDPIGGDPSGGGTPAPGWLRDLAATAATMEVPRILRPPVGGGRQSAVLILFGDGPDGPDILYIQRNQGLRRHAGQPAFPGGAVEETDDGPVTAALREAAEETGLDPSGVDVLATLPELFIVPSQFRVVPVLGWWRIPSAVHAADIGEVAAVERIPVATLADPANRFTLHNRGGRISPAFGVGQMLIWGFTGALTDRLLALGGWELPWDATATRELPEGA
jgi:8-oxo-dGTP pyrophosphatase MutT (NUDIX family)